MEKKKKPYGCSRCVKDFDKESQLKRHLKDKHNITKFGVDNEIETDPKESKRAI